MKAHFTASALGIVSCALLLIGCESPQVAQPPVAASSGLAPDYQTAESDYVSVKPASLLPEFLDDYAGKYVVFDGRFLQSAQGALIYAPGGGGFNASDMMTAIIGPPEITAPRTVSVIWSQKDRELGRPFAELSVNAPIKIYAYVLPAKQRARIKTEEAVKLRGFPIPVLLLIKAVPVQG